MGKTKLTLQFPTRPHRQRGPVETVDLPEAV